MIRRPQATDTEEDLLAFQEKFISSGEKPSASVNAQKKVKVGSKRAQQAPQDTQKQTVTQAKDVVSLQMEGGIAKPLTKKSKFKEERSKAKELKSSQDPHELMDSRDTHITKILSEIQEHRPQSYTMPTPHYTKGGFPSVQALKSTGVVMDTPKPSTELVKKSLFAQQFEAHGPSYFGVDSQGGEGPVSEGGDRDDNLNKRSIIRERANVSSLISGDGLVSVGVSAEAAKNEIKKIHEENLERLSILSEEDIKREREKIQQQLDPSLLAFIKSHHRQKQHLKPTDGGHMTTDPADGDHMTTEPTDGGHMTAEPTDGGHMTAEPTDGGHMTAEPTDGGHMTSDGGHMTAEQTSPDTVKSTVAQPLPPKLATPTSWIHMDVVEREKMEWMTDVNVHPSSGEAPASKGSNEMRFSLEGLVIPQSVILPGHLGLHHHGDEPQAAGYTLNELLSLCRSTVLQQRTFSLQLLAKIIQRAKLNEYAGVSCERGGAGEGGVAGDSVLEQLLAADVPLLLRYSLDESVGSVMFAAAACLHSLLVVPLENMVLEKYSLCHLGCVLPALRSPDLSPDFRTKEERESETDDEILRRDIVLGYLKMKLLHRLRYILEMCAPPTPLPSHLLDMVTQVTRHSLYAATEVFNCPRLMEVVFSQFLPLDWSAHKEGVVDGKACLSAMRLVHALCSASRNITASLLSHYKLSSVLVRYGVPEPSELGLPGELAHPLSTTALLTWGVALGYGLASEALRDTFSELLKQLVSMRVVHPSSMEAKRDRALLCLMEAALCVSSVTPDQLKMEGTLDTHPPPAIDWSHTQGLQSPLINLSQQLSLSAEGISCAGNVLHCLATLYSFTPAVVSPVDRLEKAEQLVQGPLASLVESTHFTKALQTLRDLSSLITPSHSSASPPASLHTHLTPLTRPKPAIFSSPTMQPADYHTLVQPCLLALAAAHLVWGCVRFMRECLNLNKALVSKIASFGSNVLYLEYLKKVAHSVTSKVSTFNLLEVYLLYDSVKFLQSCMELGASLPEECGQLTFDLAHKLLKLLPPGLECIVWDLVSTVVLHTSLIRAPNQYQFLEQDVTSLSLKDQPQPIVFQNTPAVTTTTSQLLTSSLANLPSIQSVYLLALKESDLCSMSKLIKSESILCGNPLKANSKLLPPCHTHILSKDWVLLPLMQEYNRATSKQSIADTADSERMVSAVTCSLQLLLLLEHLHPHLLSKLPTSAKLNRLMCVFLIDSELFLEKAVHDLLTSLLNLYCKDNREMDFPSPVPGLSSFMDLYSNLLEQFSAVSYGDPLFSCFLLLPLQQRFSSHLRKMVWGEHPGIIRVFSLPLAEVPVALDNFLVPMETDLQLLDMYLSALSAETVRSTWSPVFYLIAVHHVHKFVFETVEDLLGKRREKMLQRIIKIANQDTRRDLLLYAEVDTTSLKGLKLRDTLEERQSVLVSSLLGTSKDIL